MIDAAITNKIKAVAGVADRVYSGGQLVEVTKDLPKCVYTCVGLTRRYSDDGNCGLTQARYQLDIFANLPSSARAIADNIRIGMDGYKGEVEGTKIERIYFDDERHQTPERQGGDAAVSIARYTVDLVVEYREQV